VASIKNDGCPVASDFGSKLGALKQRAQPARSTLAECRDNAELVNFSSFNHANSRGREPERYGFDEGFTLFFAEQFRVAKAAWKCIQWLCMGIDERDSDGNRPGDGTAPNLIDSNQESRALSSESAL
jgi:hypothetical protein